MSWNAGGFGSMVFPDQASLDAWRKAKASHSEHDDWAGELAPPGEGIEVSAVLQGYAPSAPSDHGDLAEVIVDGLAVVLWMDVREDSFREWVGELALALRTAGNHQAKGCFHFLGLAGAEGDFGYELTIGKGGSRLKELEGKALDRIYVSDEYHSLSTRSGEAALAANPELARFVEEQRNGHRAAPGTANLYGEIHRALSKVDMAKLYAHIEHYPTQIPKGGKAMAAAALFRTSDALTAALVEPKTEEVRALGLWLLDRVDPDNGQLFAARVLDDPSTSDVLKGAAVLVLARQPTHSSLVTIASLFHGAHDVSLVLALRDTLAQVDSAELDEVLLSEFRRPFERNEHFGLSVLIDTMGKRKRLAVELAHYARSDNDYEARQTAAMAVLRSEVPEALSILEEMEELSKAGLAVAKQLFERDPMLLWRRIEVRLKSEERDINRDACIVYALEFLALPQYEGLLAVEPWHGLVAIALRLHWSLGDRAARLVPRLASDPDILAAFGEFLAAPEVYFMNLAPVISQLNTPAILPVLRERLKNAKQARGVDPKFLKKEIERLERGSMVQPSEKPAFGGKGGRGGKRKSS